MNNLTKEYEKKYKADEIARLMKKHAKKLKPFGVYCFVGVTGTLLDLGALYFFVEFLANMFWTFRAEKNKIILLTEFFLNFQW